MKNPNEQIGNRTRGITACNTLPYMYIRIYSHICTHYVLIYIYIYICVCVCVCMCMNICMYEEM